MIDLLLILILLVHINTVAYTLYIHRGKAHSYWTFHPILEHTFKFILWFFRAMPYPNWTRDYTAYHNRHHYYADTVDDPHSPDHYSLLELAMILRDKNKPTPHGFTEKDIKRFASHIDPKKEESWIEREVYYKYPTAGLAILWIIFSYYFAWLGFIVGLILFLTPRFQSVIGGIWIPHKFGFKLYNTKKASNAKQFGCWGLWWAGEELHENHHIDPSNPNWARRWYEFDLGYWYAILFSKLGLLTFKK